jgi:hypothetical protein
MVGLPRELKLKKDGELYVVQSSLVKEVFEQERVIWTGNVSGGKREEISWTEDGAMIFDAINEHRPIDVRVSKPHWWTFLGYYMEIGESLFSTVLSLRQKIRDNKKLDKYEKEFIQRNHQYFRKKEDATFDDEMDEIAKLFE